MPAPVVTDSVLEGVIGKVTDHMAALGWFDRVNGHEPKHFPGKGLTGTVWVNGIGTAASGLNSTSGAITLNIRLYLPADQGEPDRVDPLLTVATEQLMRRLIGDFTLGGTVRAIDVRGGETGGDGFSATAGYLQLDGPVMRTMTITLPVVVNDLWTETA